MKISGMKRRSFLEMIGAALTFPTTVLAGKTKTKSQKPSKPLPPGNRCFCCGSYDAIFYKPGETIWKKRRSEMDKWNEWRQEKMKKQVSAAMITAQRVFLKSDVKSSQWTNFLDEFDPVDQLDRSHFS